MEQVETKILNIELPAAILDRMRQLAKKRNHLLRAVWIEAAEMSLRKAERDGEISAEEAGR